MQATVIQSTGSWYEVRLEDGSVLIARIKGKLRLDDKKLTNPIAVGDVVEVEKSNEDATISSIYQRRNYIVRSAPQKKEFKHIIASNIDQCIIIASIAQPKTSAGFIDRILLTAYLYDIPAAVIFNKTDLVHKKKDIELLEDLIFTYQDIGHPSFGASVINNENIDRFKNMLHNKTTLLCGHSGVGKSSLVNAIEPQLDLKVGAISKYSEKGLHTTTFAKMYALASGGHIIDTPGIKEFGIIDVEADELGHYFPEIRSRMQNCRFNNCLHINETDCAVIAALERGEIAPGRYKSYVTFYAELKENNKW